MWKWVEQLEKEDFYVLSGPFRSGRQNPSSLAGNLIIVSILLIFFYGLMDVMLFFSYVEDVTIITIVVVLNIVAFILILMSIIFSFEIVYSKMPTTQYFVVICVSQFAFGYLLFWPGIFTIINDQRIVTQHFVQQLTYYIIGVHLLGIILFIYASIRMVVLLRRKKLRVHSYKAKKRERLEEKDSSAVIKFVEIGVSAFLSLVVFFNLFPNLEVETILIVSISLLLFYTMIFILPEQLTMVYCIKRFDNFQLTKSLDDD